MDNFFNELNKLSGSYEDIIICGDLNINILLGSSVVSDYQQSISSLGLQIFKTTHASPTLLDHVLVSNSEPISTYQQLLVPYFPKHDLLFIIYYKSPDKDVSIFHSFRDFNKINITNLEAEVTSMDWSSVLILPTNEAVCGFQNSVHHLFDHHVPVISKKICCWIG